MRVYTFISNKGECWSLAQRVQSEGHRALVYINEEAVRKAGNGLAEKHPEQRRVLSREGRVDGEVLEKLLYPKPDCVIIDMPITGYAELAERIRKEGYPVICGNKWSEEVEFDNSYKGKVCKTLGLTHLKDSEKTDCIDITLEVLFVNGNAVCVNSYMETLRLIDKNRGPITKGMGGVLWISNNESKMYKESFGKLIGALKKVKYRGLIRLSISVTKDKLFIKDISSIINYDSMFIFADMIKSKMSDLIYGVATGIIKKVDMRSSWGLGINIVLPHYPFECPSGLYEDERFSGVSNENAKHIWMYDIYRKDNEYLCSGCGGKIACITARGDQVEDWSPVRDAKRRVIRTLNNLSIADMIYRDDIGDSVVNRYNQLCTTGWI